MFFGNLHHLSIKFALCHFYLGQFQGALLIEKQLKLTKMLFWRLVAALFILSALGCQKVHGKLTCAPTFRYGSNMHPSCITCFDLYTNQMFLYNYETQLCEEVTECKQPKGWNVSMLRTRATAEWAFDALNRINVDPEKELFAAYVNLHGISDNVIASDSERRAIIAYNIFCQCTSNQVECSRWDKPGLIRIPDRQLTKFNGDPLPFGCTTHTKQITIVHTMEALNSSVISKELQYKLCTDVIAGRQFTARLCPETAVQNHKRHALDIQTALINKNREIQSNLTARFAQYTCPTVVDDRELSSDALQREETWLSELKTVIQTSIGSNLFAVKETATDGQYCVIKHAATINLLNAFTDSQLTAHALIAPLEAHISHDSYSKIVNWILSVKLAHHVECPQTSFQCANIPLVSDLNPAFPGGTEINLPSQDLDYLWVATRHPRLDYSIVNSAIRCPNYNATLVATETKQAHSMAHCPDIVAKTMHLKVAGIPNSQDYTNITFTHIEGEDREAIQSDVIPVQRNTDLNSLSAKNVIRLSDTLAVSVVDLTSVDRSAKVDTQILPMRHRIVRQDTSRGLCAFIAKPVYGWSSRSECGAVIEREEYEDASPVLVDLTPADAPVFRMPMPAVLRVDFGTTPLTNDNIVAAVNRAIVSYIDFGFIQAASELANGSVVKAAVSGELDTRSINGNVQCLLDSKPSNFTVRLTARDACGKQREMTWAPSLEISTPNYVQVQQKPLIVRKLQICMNKDPQFAGYAVDIDQLRRIIAAYSRIDPDYVVYTEDNIIRTMSHALFVSQNLGSTFREHVLNFRLATKCGNVYPIQVNMYIPGHQFQPPANWCRSFVTTDATAKFQVVASASRSIVDATGKRFLPVAVIKTEAAQVASIHGKSIAADTLAPTQT